MIMDKVQKTTETYLNKSKTFKHFQVFGWNSKNK